MSSLPPDRLDDAEMAYAQAKRYSQDLVRIYKQERAKRQELEIANQKLNAIWATAPNGLPGSWTVLAIRVCAPRRIAVVRTIGMMTRTAPMMLPITPPPARTWLRGPCSAAR